MVEFFLFVRKSMRKKEHHKIEIRGGEMGAEVKCFLKSRAVVQDVTQRVSGSAPGFVFHGLLRADGETSVKAGRCKVGKQGGYLSPAGKQVKTCNSIGCPVMVIVKDPLQDESPRQSQQLCLMGSGSCLCQ